MPNYNDDPNMVPLMRMSPYGGYQKPVSKYSKPDNAMPRMKDLSGDGKVTQKDVLIGRGVIDEKGDPINRKNKFCGGMSKPYSRKK